MEKRRRGEEEKRQQTVLGGLYLSFFFKNTGFIILSLETLNMVHQVVRLLVHGKAVERLLWFVDATKFHEEPRN